ncbi:MAG: transporter ATP-binding protein [Armatimonadetes bacterium]|jgi:branched-chain amino acid transport system ATP-binding protein|nr:transporter ATP-binding protein [Armatimonadota bacterium]
MALLEIDDLHVYYGAIHAVKGVSLSVEAGEVATLIGANGAGKSTTLRTVSGLQRPRQGGVRFEGKDITRLRPDQIMRLGLCQVPEGRRVFANLSVRENLEMGAYTRRDAGVKDDLESVLTTFPRLKERFSQSAGTLSGGEQQMLAMGRALMGRPRVLLLDEPSLGLAPFMVLEIFRIIREINERGTTILLVEQNARMALRAAQHGYVLETGTVVLADTGAALLDNPEVRKAYLGQD